MTAEELLEKVKPWLEKQRRPAWLPILEEGLRDPKGSHFGGGAWIPEGQAAPLCGRCQERLRLLVQLDLATLPEGAHQSLPQSGLLQVFYCEDDECEREAEAYLAFSPAHLARVVASGPGRVEESGEPFQPKSITGWEQVEDLPHPEDASEHGLRTEYDFQQNRVRFLCPEAGLDTWLSQDELEIEAVTQAREGDKLRGWPFWIQSPEYPRCPRCGSEMTNVLQIDSEKGVPHMWGDAGIVQVMQCPKDPDVLTMNWSCG